MRIAKQILAGAVLMAVSAGVSLAQVRQVQMGGGMDANPQVGAGGSNRPVPGFVPVNGNDIMTGNVSGLGYFHGRVGTSSPYQFQGNLGSSALANFARQSAGAPIGGGTYTGVAQPYYLPSAMVSTAQGTLYSAPTGSGFDSSLVPWASVSPVLSNAQFNALSGSTGAEYQAINRGAAAAPLVPGSPGAATASPLFMLRTTELSATRMEVGQPTTAPGVPEPVLPNGGTSTQPAANPGMVEGAVNGGEGAGGPGAGRDNRVTGQTAEYRLAMVSDTYLKLQEDLKEAGAGGAGGTETTEPGAMGTGDSQGRGGVDLDPLTGKPRQMATLPPLTGRGAAGRGAVPLGAAKPTLAPSAKRLAELSDEELMRGAKIKPVKMAPAPSGTVSGFDLMMLRAAKNLKDGKYLDAAESYQAALAMKPDDPLALVGRAHAEFAAGLYTGADYDLKFVFTRSPEMVALKYDVESFVPAARQEFLMEDLQKLTGKKETADMASFLYCYLCYETGRTAALQAELKTWGAREGHDDWQGVLQRAWTVK